MDKKTPDLRVRRTCSLLSLALVNLMQTRSFDKISVMHICERAMVHRATFYLHFADKYDLLRYIMAEHTKQITDESIEDLMEYINDAGTRFFEDIEKNYQVYRRILEKNESLALMDIIEQSVYDVIYKKMSVCLDEPEEIIRVKAACCSGGVVNLASKICSGKISKKTEDVVPELRKFIENII